MNLPVLEIAPEGLKGKKAKEADIIRWVFRNIDNPSVEAEDCPDPGAWTLLRRCRGDVEYEREFMFKIWPKVIPKNVDEDDDDGGARWDGKPTKILLDRLLTIKERVSKSVVKETKSQTSYFEEFEGDGS